MAIRWPFLAPVLLALMLAGCASSMSPQSDTMRAGISAPGIPGSAAPSKRYQNIGARYESEATRAQWAKHLATIWLGGHPGTRTLPEGHVLTKAEARRQFNDAASAQLSFTWFGHSSFLIRSGDAVILTDPVFSRTSGHGIFSVHRIAPVRPDPDVIDRLDAIVISHADYDHLEMGTLRRLARRFPHAVLYVPAGAAGLVDRLGFDTVRELGWWERDAAPAVSIQAVPAVHGVRRMPVHPLNASHWNGYRITLAGRSIYFSGDTGAGFIFKTIRARTGPADIALVPAGAWAPRDFERAFHVNPTEAVEIAQTMDAPLAIGMHWGTFALSAETPQQQKNTFLAAGTASVKTTVFRIGETRILR
jgi:N-acyl-phosphatidylethanolamine-hydrolysing phospholipase D